jgi:hypothetical protein
MIQNKNLKYIGSFHVVSIITHYRLDSWEFKILAGARDFPSSKTIQTGMEPIQPPIYWVPGFFPGGAEGKSRA